MNILFLGGAKRVSMARLFKKAGEPAGVDVNILSYELERNVPIATVGKVITGLKWKDAGIYDDLCRVIADEKIDIVVPFVDGAVEVAARLPHLCGVFVPCSAPEACAAMFNKIAAAGLFENAGIPIPRTWHDGMPCSALIAKPAFGSASKGIAAIDSREDLDRLLAHHPDTEYLVQERIDNRREYTVDCYVSVRTGKPLVMSPRLRIEVSGGEVTRTRTVESPELCRLTENVLSATGLRGAVTVQFIHDLDRNRFLLMEVNPRLGGGAVCTVAAGANIPLAILNEALGGEIKLMNAEADVEMARYPSEVFFMKR